MGCTALSLLPLWLVCATLKIGHRRSYNSEDALDRCSKRCDFCNQNFTRMTKHSEQGPYLIMTLSAVFWSGDDMEEWSRIWEIPFL